MNHFNLLSRAKRREWRTAGGVEVMSGCVGEGGDGGVEC